MNHYKPCENSASLICQIYVGEGQESKYNFSSNLQTWRRSRRDHIPSKTLQSLFGPGHFRRAGLDPVEYFGLHHTVITFSTPDQMNHHTRGENELIRFNGLVVFLLCLHFSLHECVLCVFFAWSVLRWCCVFVLRCMCRTCGSFLRTICS